MAKIGDFEYNLGALGGIGKPGHMDLNQKAKLALVQEAVSGFTGGYTAPTGGTMTRRMERLRNDPRIQQSLASLRQQAETYRPQYEQKQAYMNRQLGQEEINFLKGIADASKSSQVSQSKLQLGLGKGGKITSASTQQTLASLPQSLRDLLSSSEFKDVADPLHAGGKRDTSKFALAAIQGALPTLREYGLETTQKALSLSQAFQGYTGRSRVGVTDIAKALSSGDEGLMNNLKEQLNARKTQIEKAFAGTRQSSIERDRGGVFQAMGTDLANINQFLETGEVGGPFARQTGLTGAKQASTRAFNLRRAASEQKPSARGVVTPGFYTEQVKGYTPEQIRQATIDQAKSFNTGKIGQANRLRYIQQFGGAAEQGIYGRPDQFITQQGKAQKFTPGTLERSPEQSAFIENYLKQLKSKENKALENNNKAKAYMAKTQGAFAVGDASYNELVKSSIRGMGQPTPYDGYQQYMQQYGNQQQQSPRGVDNRMSALYTQGTAYNFQQQQMQNAPFNPQQGYQASYYQY